MKNKTKQAPRPKSRAGNLPFIIPCSILLFLAFLAFFSAKWYVNTYGQLGFDSILFTLLSAMDGVESDLIFGYLFSAFLPTVGCTVLLCLAFFRPFAKRLILEILPRFRMQLFPFHRVVSLVLSIVLFCGLILQAAKDSQLLEYMQYLEEDSTLFENEYRDPADTKITFPREKRNLIYIFLESMETTYFSQEQGGHLNYCTAPELYELADSNVNFSHNSGFGGLYTPYGTTWTIGAMVAQSSGIPLKLPSSVSGNDYGDDDTFLPGITTLSDVLHENGYYQALMVGSDAAFGGREAYYKAHGTDRIYDLYTARKDKLIPKDYKVWWGFEDQRLFRYAKKALLELSEKDQPFAFTMLTADTHHVDGYPCKKCDDEFDLQYENVIACSSKQVAEFVSWIQEQDFYENTTIVIVGDHLTMDNRYIQNVGAENFDRRVYNCIINSAATASNTTDRVAFTTDMFPTTLAAMGCTIDGNRLGLGTNLFSDKPTLAEEMGLEKLNQEMGANSSYYTSNFFFTE